MIYGDIEASPEEEDNRDKRIQEFKDDPNPRVLIATPASLAESVSLHINSKTGEKVCSNAIYLDRNYNGAQFMQSMDRIHRLGMDKKTQVVYHLIIGKGTIDEKIDDRLWQKFVEMSDALNDSWPRVLDYDGTREEISKEEAQKDFKSLVDHLKEQKKYELEERKFSDEEWQNEFKPKLEKLQNERSEFQNGEHMCEVLNMTLRYDTRKNFICPAYRLCLFEDIASEL